ncbi:MAG: DUF4878 domain-containing protein [Eubacteriales bacterium]|nr:DUF4878 domain-containing protein [Eubacteriales bacterium]
MNNNNMNGGYPPQGMPPNQVPPQGMPPNQASQGMAPQGMPQQGMAPQGMPPQGMPPQGYGQQGHPNAGGPPKKSKKGLIIGLSVGAVAIIAVVVLLIVFLKGGGKAGTTPEATVKAALTALKDADIKKVMDCTDISPEEREKVLAEMETPEMKLGMDLAKGLLKNMEFEILDSEDHGDGTATVSVKMKMSFMGNEEEKIDDMELIQKDGKWYLKTSGVPSDMMDFLK